MPDDVKFDNHKMESEIGLVRRFHIIEMHLFLTCVADLRYMPDDVKFDEE